MICEGDRVVHSTKCLFFFTATNDESNVSDWFPPSPKLGCDND